MVQRRLPKNKAGSTSGILIRNASLAATCDDKNRRIPNASILIEGREITYVGPELPRHRLKALGSCRLIDASGCVVLPGFVNTHHHFFQVFTRGIAPAQDAGLFRWLTYLYGVWQRLSPEHVGAAALAAVGELLLTGCTTTVDQMYLFPKRKPPLTLDDEIRAAAVAGIRFHPCYGSMSVGESLGGLPPDILVQPEDVILRESERLIETYHDPGKFSLCRLALAPCAPFNVSRELLKKTARLARQKKVLMHTHLAETRDEEEYCRRVHGGRPLDYMESVEWLGPDVWFAHCVHLNDREIRRLARTGTGVAHCPTSNLRLGSGIAPVRKMLDEGVRVGLAVDGASSNDSSDMLGELRQCLLVHRIRSGPDSMSANEVLRMATRGGASLLGRDDIGSLAPGMAADVAIFDMRPLGYAGAVHDPLAALLFCGDSHIARTVIVNGRVVVDNGRLTGINEERLAERVNALARLIARPGRGKGEKR